MNAYVIENIQRNGGLYFGSSLFGLAKVWIYSTRVFLQGMDHHGALLFMPRYFWFAAACYALAVLFLFMVRMALWKKVALLVCCMVLLPFVSPDCRLMLLFIPMLLFLLEKEKAGEDPLFCALFGLLLIPTGYLNFVFDPVFSVAPREVSDSVVIHPLLLLCLVSAILFSALRSSRRCF